MHKYRFFLKGSNREQMWINRVLQRHYQLTAVHGWRYEFTPTAQPQAIVTEYVAKTDLAALVAELHPVSSLVNRHGNYAVTYSRVVGEARIVQHDQTARLAVYRAAREQSLNWLNAWVGMSWLLICASLIMGIPAGMAAAPAIELGLVLGVSSVVFVSGLLASLTATVRCHREVRRLVQLTGDDQTAWKPTLYVTFKHQTGLPDTAAWAELGRWQLTLANQQGDYFFNLQTNLSVPEIRNSLNKMINQRDFTVTQWLGSYPL